MSDKTAGDDAPPFADRAALLAPRKVRYGTFTLPVLGLAVRFRSLSEMEYSDYQTSRMQAPSGEGDDLEGAAKADLQAARPALIALCLVDAKGTNLFSPADLEGIAAAFDAGDSAALFDVLVEHCGLNRRRQVEAAKKN